MPEILTAVFSFLGIIGLIFLTYYVSRKLNRRTSVGNSKSIKILERAVFGQDKSIVIVKVGGKFMLLGVSSQHIDKISDLDENDISEYLNAPTSQNSDFFSNLKKAAGEHQFVKPFLSKEKQGDHKDEQ